ncbi:MAG: sulfur carrier protein ThiS [Maribacter dokdonensis]|uniref:Sulfur carrier protein n=1 Tax=Maribacter dokdonensis TaxID=320912 RepID=A0ABY0UB79_9FLAO|nr:MULTISPECIES: sulfur carrier protein ThiS [Maribacter]MDP2524546.1 sulfur carrier protein ThiS [Maribacter dokdonensis]PHN92316.1 thiamine biosynthesis protein ThiS [Maribacter sp. 6B07]CAG2532647.1 sulfur carrier protein [Maribacter dokdonensis]SDS38261.1 sulfur carrier protein [Maribacter dokdonensis]|tara:strand:+ start:100 stop:303 length:204 start_codon:yes stop_codon:yes gene_type:complete
MINIIVNDTPHLFRPDTTLDLIIKELKISENGIAVAVNENIITKSAWNTKTLNENDKVLVIRATQGG